MIIDEQENTGCKNFQIGWREKGEKSVRIKIDSSLSTMKVLESKTNKNYDIIQKLWHYPINWSIEKKKNANIVYSKQGNTDI